MDFISNNLLSLILFSPMLVALVLLFLPRRREKLLRWVALLGSLVPFGFSLYLVVSL